MNFLNKPVLVAMIAAVLSMVALPAQAKGTVKDKTKVTATWVSPTDGSVFVAPATLVLTADAVPSQANHPVVLVEFFNGTTVIGSQTMPTVAGGSRYQFAWTNVTPGTYSLMVAATDDKGNFYETLPVTVTVIKANQAITGFNPASPITYSSGASFALTATGGASGNPVTFTSTTPGVCTVSGNIATIQSAGTCSLTADQAGDINYNAAPPVQATVTINPAPQAIAGFNPVSSMTYAPGATITLNAMGGSSGSPVVFASTTPGVCTVSGNTATIQSAGTCTLTADQAGNGNYFAAPTVTRSINIAPAPQSISGFNPLSPISYAVAPNNTFALTANGGASGNPVVFASTTPGTCSVAGNIATILGAGLCTLTANQAAASNGNYLAAPSVTASVTINPAAQAIAFAGPGNQTVGASAPLSATASSGLAVSFTATPASVCTLAGNVLTAIAAGSCTLTADQAGNANYLAAPQVTVNVTINPASQAISGFAPATPVAFAVAPNNTFTLTATGGSSGNAVTFASTAPAVCTVAGNVVTIQAAGSCTLTADQAGNANYLAAPQVTATVVITTTATITLTSPAANASFNAPAAITLTAMANEPGGSIAKVEFYQGATLIGAVVTGATGNSGATYTFNWTNVQPGSYAITAKVTDGNGQVVTSMPTAITVLQATAQVYYIHADHLGTPRAITKAVDNAKVWEWKNDEPFGANLPNENPSGLGAFVFNLRFPGQYYDQETGTYYNRFRDYDPATGRYVESDPIGLAGGINIYAYVEGNPLSFMDPLGLQAAAAGLGLELGGGALCCKPNKNKSAGPTGYPDLDGETKSWQSFWPNWMMSESSKPDDSKIIGGAKVPPYPGLKDLSECTPGQRMVEPALNKQFKGGVSIQQAYTCPCGPITRHTIILNGLIVHDHFRPGLPKIGGD